eukprot:TRINITY_DN9666_c0_g1_i1.p1 TRINITY_DN9666_c0_g1~~TRINITY_DN9666_c0_g1_i1.p1  ORF type:complete len:302 (+),score=60.13 TRINITY_DN9666_c0_g1_i1:55-960(+)
MALSGHVHSLLSVDRLLADPAFKEPLCPPLYLSRALFEPNIRISRCQRKRDLFWRPKKNSYIRTQPLVVQASIVNPSAGAVLTVPEDARPATAEGRVEVAKAEEEWRLGVESYIEKIIFNCRFFTLMAVAGSLCGALLCFSQGCWLIIACIRDFMRWCWAGNGKGRMILLVVEAVDVYLIGTVMLIFGIGLYELFVKPLQLQVGPDGKRHSVEGFNSNLFGFFRLKERPRWLKINSLDELKTKLGHVIVMVLLVGIFEKSKKVSVHSAMELFYLSTSVAVAAGCIFFLSKLSEGHHDEDEE